MTQRKCARMRQRRSRQRSSLITTWRRSKGATRRISDSNVATKAATRRQASRQARYALALDSRQTEQHGSQAAAQPPSRNVQTRDKVRPGRSNEQEKHRARPSANQRQRNTGATELRSNKVTKRGRSKEAPRQQTSEAAKHHRCEPTKE